MNAAERALDFIKAGDRIGLGTGHAAWSFAETLAAHVKGGLDVRAVPTSRETEEHARSLGIPLVRLSDVEALDVTVDGADEVAPNLDLIKGYGGALLREKVVAAASRQLVILVGEEKLVPVLGTRGVLPVEVVPFALPFCVRRLADIGLPASPRMEGEHLFVTDNGNYMVHCAVSPMTSPAEVLARIRSVPGVVEAGLFLGFAHRVIVQKGDRVEVLECDRKS